MLAFLSAGVMQRIIAERRAAVVSNTHASSLPAVTDADGTFT